MLKRGVPADSSVDARASKRWRQKDVDISRYRATLKAQDVLDTCFDEEYGTDGHIINQDYRHLPSGIPHHAYGRQHTELQPHKTLLSQPTTGSVVHRSYAQRNTSNRLTTTKQPSGSVCEASDSRHTDSLARAHHNQARQGSANGHFNDDVVLSHSRYATTGHATSMYNLLASDDKKDVRKPPGTHARMPFVIDDDSDPDDLLGLDRSDDEVTHHSIRQGGHADAYSQGSRGHQQANAVSKHRSTVSVQDTLSSAQQTQSKQQIASSKTANTPKQSFRAQTPLITKALVHTPPAKQPAVQRSTELQPSAPTSHATRSETILPPSRPKQQNKAVVAKNAVTTTRPDAKSREADTGHMNNVIVKEDRSSGTLHKPDKQSPDHHHPAISHTQRSSNPIQENKTAATLPAGQIIPSASISHDAKQINSTSSFQNIVARLQADSRDAILDEKSTLVAPAALASSTQPFKSSEKPGDNNIKITSKTPVRDDSAITTQILRQRRIEDKKERNRRNREEVPVSEPQIVDTLDAKPQHTTQVPRSSTAILPSKQTLPSLTSQSRKPFALNSAAGLNAIRLSCEQGTVSTAKDYRPHSRKLGRVTARDLHVRNWKDNGMCSRDIASLYERQTGVKRHYDTLRKRVSQVTKALQMAGITQKLIDAVLQEDHGAEDELNDLLTERLNGTAVQTGLSTDGCTHEDGAAEVKLVTSLRPSEHDTMLEKHDSPLEASSEHSVRPTTGGKRPTWEYLEACWSATVEQADDVQSSPSRASSTDPEGYVHFEYQVQRRECSSRQQTNDGMDIDDAQWFEVDEPYTSLIKANASASGPVLLMRFGDDPIVDGEHSFELKHNKDEDGAALCEYTSINGTVQTRVLQRLRTFRDRVPARSKAGWLPRTLYHIKQRITKRQKDEMFDEGPVVDVRETFIDGSTSADARWANGKAIERFVDLTYEAKSANLNRRDIEMAELRSVLGAEMEEFNLFSASKEISKGLVEVWVEKGSLVGPRNL